MLTVWQIILLSLGLWWLVANHVQIEHSDTLGPVQSEGERRWEDKVPVILTEAKEQFLDQWKRVHTALVPSPKRWKRWKKYYYKEFRIPVNFTIPGFRAKVYWHSTTSTMAEGWENLGAKAGDR